MSLLQQDRKDLPSLFAKRLYNHVQCGIQICGEFSVVGYPSMIPVMLFYYFFLQSQRDTEERCTEIVDFVMKLNSTVLSYFMCAIICPVSLAHDVRDMFDRKRASMTQGIVHHKQNLSHK